MKATVQVQMAKLAESFGFVRQSSPCVGISLTHPDGHTLTIQRNGAFQFTNGKDGGFGEHKPTKPSTAVQVLQKLLGERVTKPFDKVSAIMAFENGELDEDGTVQMFQAMIDDGSVWLLQGSYGRAAMGLIEAGKCMLGPVGHRDYWGNYVPSRTEVQAGTKGSPEYVAAHSDVE